MTKDQQYKIIFENWKKYSDLPNTINELEDEPLPSVKPDKELEDLDISKVKGDEEYELARTAALGFFGGSAALGIAKRAWNALGGAGQTAAGLGIYEAIKKIGIKRIALGMLTKGAIPLSLAYTAWEIYQHYKGSGAEKTDPEFKKFKNSKEAKEIQKEAEKLNKKKPEKLNKKKPETGGAAPAANTHGALDNIDLSDKSQDLGDPRQKPGFAKHRGHYYFGEPNKLSIPQIYKLAKEAGFKHKDAITMTMIAMEESLGGMTNIHSHSGLARGDASYGLWQINMLGKMGPDRREKYNLSSNNDLFDPKTNARIAYDMATNGGSRPARFTPWGAFSTGKYGKHAARVRRALKSRKVRVATQRYR